MDCVVPSFQMYEGKRCCALTNTPVTALHWNHRKGAGARGVGRDIRRRREGVPLDPARERRSTCLTEKVKDDGVAFSFASTALFTPSTGRKDHRGPSRLRKDRAESEYSKGREGMGKGETKDKGRKEVFLDDQIHSTCSSAGVSFQLNARTYPMHFRMFLLSRALTQHIALQDLRAERKEVLGKDDFLPEHSVASTTSSIVQRKVLEEWCSMSHISTSAEAIEKLINASLMIPLDEDREWFHLRPALYMREQEILGTLKEEISSKWSGSGGGGGKDGDTCLATMSTSALSTASPTPTPPYHAQPPKNGDTNATGTQQRSKEGGGKTDEVERHLDNIVPPMLESVVQERITALEKEKQRMSQELSDALRQGGQFGRGIFLFTAFAIACQIAIVARLTFFELDWDTMEPITYCFGVFITIVFYVFFLRYGKECTCDEVFQSVVPFYVRRWAPKNFDWKRYEEVCRELEEEQEMRRRIREWASQN